MAARAWVPDGLYRMIKWQEDGNPLFPTREAIVEVRNGVVINLSTGRHCALSLIGVERSLFGPLNGPYDPSQLAKLNRIDLDGCERSTTTRIPGFS